MEHISAVIVVSRRNSLKRHVATKSLLSVLASKVLYPARRAMFYENAPFPEKLKIDGTDQPEFWFAQPEFHHKRRQLEPKCLDSHHLLVNLRSKVCRDGLPGYGISKDAWWKVSFKYNEVISRALVCDLIDKQSNSYARKTFSLEVEEK